MRSHRHRDYSRAIQKSAQINDVVRRLQREISAYLDWTTSPIVSELALEQTEVLLRNIKRVAETAFEMQDGNYSVSVLAQQRRTKR